MAATHSATFLQFMRDLPSMVESVPSAMDEDDPRVSAGRRHLITLGAGELPREWRAGVRWPARPWRPSFESQAEMKPARPPAAGSDEPEIPADPLRRRAAPTPRPREPGSPRGDPRAGASEAPRLPSTIRAGPPGGSPAMAWRAAGR